MFVGGSSCDLARTRPPPPAGDDHTGGGHREGRGRRPVGVVRFPGARS